MEHRNRRRRPREALDVGEVLERRWMLEYPSLDSEAMDEFDDAVKRWRIGAPGLDLAS